ncbi:MAG: sugar-binding domain-containing protein [Microbacteriaceae bacterium]
MADDVFPRPSTQDGTYPRPQLVRPQWADLGGEWGFDHDDDDRGRRDGWAEPGRAAARSILVPYPPESELSGIGDTGHHPVVWYRRALTDADLEAAGWTGDGTLLLRFGAVDYRAEVWADGRLLGSHEGGHTPFAVDVTEAVLRNAHAEIVVRAEDDPLDLEMPRGKQDWHVDPHVIWYHRTTGIWQTVWLEAVPEQHVTSLGWASDLPAARVSLDVAFATRPRPGHTLHVAIADADGVVATASRTVGAPRERLEIALPGLENGQGYEHLLWSPEHPRLLDARVELRDADGELVDEVASYLGLRSVAASGDSFLLNDRPHPVIAVLEQGYWPESHLAAPSVDALRAEVQLIKDLGFTTARVHQKIEDPRFLFWADRLGLMIWEELPSAYAFSPTSIERLTREWTEAIARDRSHPSVVCWVPINESWGVQHIAHDPRQRDLVRGLYHLTRALDGTRPVISNDGWEHAESDLFTVHDYDNVRARLAASYADGAAVESTVRGIGPAGRRMSVLDAGSSAAAGLPVIVSEFGGVTWAPNSPIETWGYAVADSAEDFERRLREVFGALQESSALAGYCYTQLTDTLQEANGLLGEDRSPKLPLETLREIIRGPHR